MNNSKTQGRIAVVKVPLQVVLGGRELRLDELARIGEGTFNLCIPYLTIEPIIPKLSARYWYSRGAGATGRLKLSCTSKQKCCPCEN